ncbi:MAG: glycosyltransferase [Rhizobiaceae bacterium]|nr:glycosyltransferase [Rhizobiaceae bacterium]
MLSRSKVAIVLKGYPRLSETFIAQEILGLQTAGLDLELVSLRHPTDTKRHPVHEEITAPVRYLPEYVHQEPRRCFAAWLKARRLPGYRRARTVWLNDLWRDRTRNRVRRFVQAMVAATELGEDVGWLYGHFIHTPGSVTRYAAIMRDLPYSISAHAKDIWTSPDWELSEKLDDAQWTVTCTKGGADHLASLAANKRAVRLLYHGLDLTRFPAPDDGQAGSHNDGSSATRTVSLLSVGRAVEKKGFDTLLQALSLLPPNLHWRWVHIAGGPLLADLKQQGDDLGISEKLEFLGSQAQSRVLQAYRECDMFVLPCRIAADGDRDGLPNVIVEAQSQGVPVISTPISGIPELIENGANGLLVAPNNCEQLAAAIVQLSRDPDRRKSMGQHGINIVHQKFDAANEINQLIDLVRQA